MGMLYVRNTLSGKKEVFEPLKPPYVKMYACGITTYDDSHIGHAMQALAFQMIRRYLSYIGYKVVYVRNYTDVDDKILARAQTLSLPAAELSKQIIASTQEDFACLGIEPADHRPKVSEMIPEIIAFIGSLVEKGAAYSTEGGHVYFRVRSFPEYGKLSSRVVDEQQHLSRDIISDGKQDPLDFALWKADVDESFSWDSPWGRGRPGWHIECSAMIHALLGEHIDIHGGGRDLVFPHHENEIAQSESCYGKPLAKYWLHSGLLTIDGQKMSKSLGNHISIKEFLGQYPPEVLKYVCLEHHYHLDRDLSHKAFIQGEKKLFSYYTLLGRIDAVLRANKDPVPSEAQLCDWYVRFKGEFTSAMNDDFNTVKALATIHSLFKDARAVMDTYTKAKKGENHTKGEDMIAILLQFQQCIVDIRMVLGIFSEAPQVFIAGHRSRHLERLGLSEELVEEKILARTKARSCGDFVLADKLRDELASVGIMVKDAESMATQWTFHYD